MKQIIYFRFPFISHNINQLINKEIKEVFRSFLPQITPQLSVYNSFKLKSFFKNKDKIPNGLCTSTVYLFQCPCCQQGYIGSSLTNLSLRADQHRAVSSRTHRPLVRPTTSSIRNHCENICKVQFNFENFKIIREFLPPWN